MHVWNGSSILLLVAWAAAALVAVPAVADDRDGPLPHIDRVGPVDPAPPDGHLRLAPAVVEVRVPPDRRVEVRHVLANGTEQSLDLDVEVVAAAVTEVGPRATDDPLGDGVRLAAPVDRLHLEPGAGAELVSTAQADAGEAALLALRATAPDGSTATAWVVVAAEEERARPALDLDLASDGAATLAVRAARPAVLDVRLRARTWVRHTTDSTVADLLAGPVRREVDAGAPAAGVPGPVTAVAVAEAATGETVTVTATRTVLPPVGVAAAALGVLLLAVAAGAWRRRHRRRRTRSDEGSQPAGS